MREHNIGDVVGRQALRAQSISATPANTECSSVPRHGRPVAGPPPGLYCRAMTRLAWMVHLDDSELRAAVDRLRDRLRLAGVDEVDPPEADAVIVWADRDLASTAIGTLLSGAVPVLLAGPTLRSADGDGRLGEAAGLRLGAQTPVHDVRVQPGADGAGFRHAGHIHVGGGHIGPHEHITDGVAVVDKVLDDVEVLRVAAVGLSEQPVLTWRAATGVGAWTLGCNPHSLDGRTTLRALLDFVSHARGLGRSPDIRVGLLGYGAIGHEHRRAVEAVDGLTLTAVCDSSQERREAAIAVAPGIVTLDDADALIAREDVDLVVVSTPPNSHAYWASRAIRAGKHVVVEKPFAIRTDEADTILSEAAASDRLAVVYQNRRFDPDHLAIKRAVAAGSLGDVFHVETFVGGFGHPCNLWHSDDEVSGGAFYDWGSHVLDQILDLIPTKVAHVTAAEHKRLWHDITNADHSRVTLLFEDGTEAEFIHSDMAAALKPRWYVLGTQGAIVGNWREERVVSRNDIGTLTEDVLAPADSPPTLELHDADGSVTRLATPAADRYPFHRELAEHLHLGLPMSVTGSQSRRVLSVMEAARLSASEGSRPVVPS